MPWLVVAGCIAIAAVAWVTFGSLREELLPREDRAVALLRVSAPQGVSLDYTAAKMRDIEELAAPLVQSGEVQNVFSIAGSGGANGGFAVFTLAPWGERVRSQNDIVGDNRSCQPVFAL